MILDDMHQRMTVNEAFVYCQRLAGDHYENFPVASLLIPRQLRPFIASIYAFARIADDFADEGDLPATDRLIQLDDWESKLNACYAGRADHPVFIALRATVEATGISRNLLAALLQAFRMDVVKHRYVTFEEVMQYCGNSANPIGRLVLQVFGQANKQTLPLSDHICTALQLTNFWQDIARDYQRGRVYIPLEDFDRFGYTENDLSRWVADDRLRAVVRFEVERTRKLFALGSQLVARTSGRLRWELGATVAGGRAVLDGIERLAWNTQAGRPTLSVSDKLWMIWSAALGRGI
jgi:phytoene synthase